MKKRRTKGFLQPCLLLQLYRQDRHGYELLQGLNDYLSDANAYDPSVIYRFMRGMEADGLVDSYEGDVSFGPKRRVYRLTEEGKQQLGIWVEALKRSRDEIDHLVAIYEKRINNRA